MDSIDLDALLIGALYGELTPADEARLTAHLESHPADRTALAELTHTRGQVRDSRLFAVQLEPPQAVMTRVMQEAVRRAPHKPSESWFQRFVRSLTAHPAMAAAMTLVLVVGVAGTLYMRHEDGFGAPPPEMVTAAREPAPDPAAVATSTPPAPADPAAPTPADPAAPATGSWAAGSASAGPGAAGEGSVKGGVEKSAELARDAVAMAPAVTAPAAPSGGGGAPARHLRQGIEVHGSTGLVPKDLPAADERKFAKVDRDGFADRKEASGGAAPGGAPIGMAAASPSPSAAAPPPPPAEASKRVAPEADVVAQAPAAGAAAPEPAPAYGANKLRVQERAPEPAPAGGTDGWAQKQHEQVVAYVRANNCRAAAVAASEIYSRAPEYYAANVEVDRSIKPCLAYLNTERERRQRARAAKPVK
ncbi:MAG TPA: hypothetical protein VGC42_22980 [Kofleriaceae bacterium]